MLSVGRKVKPASFGFIFFPKLLVQVDVGDFLRFKSCVLYTQLENPSQPLINIEVEAHVTRPELRTSEVSSWNEEAVISLQLYLITLNSLWHNQVFFFLYTIWNVIYAEMIRCSKILLKFNIHHYRHCCHNYHHHSHNSSIEGLKK